MNKDPLILFIDLFCGAGGTTSGIENSYLRERKMAKVIACVNHDANAINSHYLNHPDVRHFTEDIRRLDVGKLLVWVQEIRAKYPSAKLAIWASLECIFFSKAKGGQSRMSDSRTLALDLYRYLDILKPDYLFIENVVEFKDWGPLRVKCLKTNARYSTLATDKKGNLIYQPVKEKKGVDYNAWVAHLRDHYKYSYSMRVLNCADHGLRTIRKRLFIQFAQPGIPVAWPEPSHAKNGKGGLPTWLPVRPLLDLDDVGKCIFTNPKLKSEKSRERILAGCVKYIAQGDTSFLSKYFSGPPAGMNVPLSEPAGAVTTKDHHALVNAQFVSVYNSPGYNSSLEEPCPTVMTKDRVSLTSAQFVTKYNSTDSNGKVSPGQSLETPCFTVAAQDRLSLTSAQFITKRFTSHNGKRVNTGASVDSPAPTILATPTNNLVTAVCLQHYYSCKGMVSSVDEPGWAVRTKDGTGLVQAQWMDKQFSGTLNHHSLDQPAGSVLGNPKSALCTAEKLLYSDQYEGRLRSIDDPTTTVLASKRQQYLMDMQFHNPARSLDVPGPTIIAHQNKKPLYLVSTEEGDMLIEVYDTDTPATVKLKKFMAAFRICSINMRMLNEVELLKIQDFPGDYKLVGNQAQRKKYIGNAVPPGIAMRIIGATAAELLKVLVEQQNLFAA